ncbi:hypothetical protein PTTG_26200 [Puccinia triticina 1-1 BBBD Race 1]|uniref:DDE_3 domain-containing protein n=1 Tax=Puccinia triticina (isolate 1-1 / race 1 (BBBD)) TaxID=630390 RepID=A0A180GY77_PUCT1|nr:hypothetical protein PTTG_26200 [Puccinia triticina 1-1 BBBD Race 1]
MGFCKFDPGTKIAAIQLLTQSYSRTKPGLFLDELGERLYNETNTLMSITLLHRNLVKNMEITLKKANTINIRKSLVAKFKFVAWMQSIPAEYIIFTDESGICSKDLLHTHSRLAKGRQADRTIVDQNAKRYTLLPAIGFDGVLAMTVTDKNMKGANFAHFLKYFLLPRMNRYPDRNSMLVLNNVRIHSTLVGCPDAKWEIERTLYQTVSAWLCQKLFKHAGYHCPDTSNDSDLHEFHFSG